jgi:hypothetical protein
MYLKKRTVEVFFRPTEPEPGGSRKNLAVHVSLSSNLHNVKELTPFASLDGGVGGGRASGISRTVVLLRLPGSRPALSEIAEQWERLALDVVSGAGCSRDA